MITNRSTDRHNHALIINIQKYTVELKVSGDCVFSSDHKEMKFMAKTVNLRPIDVMQRRVTLIIKGFMCEGTPKI